MKKTKLLAPILTSSIFLGSVVPTLTSCENKDPEKPTTPTDVKIIGEKSLELHPTETADLPKFQVLPEDFSQEVEWESTNEEVAKIENGKISAIAEGETLIKVHPKGFSMSDSCLVTVVNEPQPETIELSLNSTVVGVGDLLYASVNTTKEVIWSSSEEDVAEISPQGVITTKSEGTSTIGVRLKDQEDVSDSIQIHVTSNQHLSLTEPIASESSTYLTPELTIENMFNPSVSTPYVFDVDPTLTQTDWKGPFSKYGQFQFWENNPKSTDPAILANYDFVVTRVEINKSGYKKELHFSEHDEENCYWIRNDGSGESPQYSICFKNDEALTASTSISFHIIFKSLGATTTSYPYYINKIGTIAPTKLNINFSKSGVIKGGETFVATATDQCGSPTPVEWELDDPLNWIKSFPQEDGSIKFLGNTRGTPTVQSFSLSAKSKINDTVKATKTFEIGNSLSIDNWTPITKYDCPSFQDVFEYGPQILTSESMCLELDHSDFKKTTVNTPSHGSFMFMSPTQREIQVDVAFEILNVRVDGVFLTPGSSSGQKCFWQNNSTLYWNAPMTTTSFVEIYLHPVAQVSPERCHLEYKTWA